MDTCGCHTSLPRQGTCSYLTSRGWGSAILPCLEGEPEILVKSTKDSHSKHHRLREGWEGDKGGSEDQDGVGIGG